MNYYLLLSGDVAMEGVWDLVFFHSAINQETFIESCLKNDISLYEIEGGNISIVENINDSEMDFLEKNDAALFKLIVSKKYLKSHITYKRFLAIH